MINRWTGVGGALEPDPDRLCGEMRDPGRTEGDQEMALHPVACAVNNEASQVPSSTKVSIQSRGS